ncbi:hypothetical protein JavanS260_0010 [Streptococcus satellite phage Javan260]|uniref:Uncharacterized protein n=1 Tax=Streptococcus agalactiae LMG 14747 TaxID=1154860 RepID=V6Z0R8_STRAG|nr:hypothetical protein [Streptococcus hyovaginalis]ESV53806.1 hypothetical protein SAG0136_00710 [Streptococcus agalactiae LMG 14747]QBX08436.1 hypothetical protein JavanS260_0010 [Streptococcus satellite phage Javan260]
MTYTIDIYPNPENAPDKPYFTEKIFLGSCQREVNNLNLVKNLLNEIITDEESKEAVLGVLKRQTTLLNSMIYGVKSKQIIFTNPDRQTEVTE